MYGRSLHHPVQSLHTLTVDQPSYTQQSVSRSVTPPASPPDPLSTRAWIMVQSMHVFPSIEYLNPNLILFQVYSTSITQTAKSRHPSSYSTHATASITVMLSPFNRIRPIDQYFPRPEWCIHRSSISLILPCVRLVTTTSLSLPTSPATEHEYQHSTESLHPLMKSQ